MNSTPCSETQTRAPEEAALPETAGTVRQHMSPRGTLSYFIDVTQCPHCGVPHEHYVGYIAPVSAILGCPTTGLNYLVRTLAPEARP